MSPSPEVLRALDPTGEPLRGLAALKRRALAEVTRKPGTWHAVEFTFGVAVALAALRRDGDALTLLGSLYDLRGVDPQGNSLDLWADGALAYAARRLRALGRGAEADALDARRAALARAGETPEAQGPLRALLAEMDAEPPLGALCSAARVASHGALRAAAGRDAARYARLVDEAEALLARRVSGGRAPRDGKRSGALTFTAAGLARAAEGERRPRRAALLRELARALGPGATPEDRSRVLLAAVALYDALGDPAAAQAALDEATAAASPRARGLERTYLTCALALRARVLDRLGDQDGAAKARALVPPERGGPRAAARWAQQLFIARETSDLELETPADLLGVGAVLGVWWRCASGAHPSVREGYAELATALAARVRAAIDGR
ncbi:MAG: hypothetical protein HY909_31370 [Deltaproteobacteria bacterium]|nr:hypothetical protein [Deltaproteobacteria bacterium]